MSNEFLFFVIGVLIVGIAIHAYNMGWQAGHDVHHDDDTHGPNLVNKDPDDKPKMWV